MTGATSGAETAYTSGAPEFIPVIQWCLCCSISYFYQIPTALNR